MKKILIIILIIGFTVSSFNVSRVNAMQSGYLGGDSPPPAVDVTGGSPAPTNTSGSAIGAPNSSTGSSVNAAGPGGSPAGSTGNIPAGSTGNIPAGSTGNIPAGSTGGSANNSNSSFSKISNPLKVGSIRDVIFLLVDIAVYLGGAFAVLAIIYVGFEFVLAQGKPEKIKEAKMKFLYIIVGLAILISAKAIVVIVQNTLVNSGVVDKSVFNN